VKTDSDHLFPVDPTQRAIARELYDVAAPLPLISPHGHVDPSILAEDTPFSDRTHRSPIRPGSSWCPTTTSPGCC
jgi:glucuronate isomerase